MKKAPERAKTPKQVIRARRKNLRERAEVTTFLKRLAILAALLFVLLGLVFGIAPARDAGMRPAIAQGDLVFYFRFNQSYNDREVVVWDDDGTTRIGRIVARGGDTVDIRQDGDGALYINGNKAVEAENATATQPVSGGKVTYPVTLSADEVFILGDYRIGATDSRTTGPVKRSNIKGSALIVIRSGDGL